MIYIIFLNSTLDGQIGIGLGIYENTKELNYTKLKHMIILRLLQKDPLNYK